MASDRPVTLFPGPKQEAASGRTESTIFYTRLRRELSSIPEESVPPIQAENKGKLPKLAPLRPVNPNPPSAAPSKPPPVIYESPWDRYNRLPLSTLKRGSKIIVAYSRTDVVKMVSINKLPSDFKQPELNRHKNLLAILEQYRYEGAHYIVTDYTAASLKSLINIPIPFDERHVSVTCRQGSSLSCLSIIHH
jgi:hypothetical protein